MRQRGRGRGRHRKGQGMGGGGWGRGYGRGWGRPDVPPPDDATPAPSPDDKPAPTENGVERQHIVPRPVFLNFDELEALRLVDLEGLYQEEASRLLGISRRTLWSDLKNARMKVVTALVEGRPIRIIGGSRVIMER